MKFIHLLTFSLFWLFGAIVSCFSYSMICRFGKCVGLCLYHLHRPFRKKALTNLAIAFGDSLSEKEREKIAKESFQSLTITCLEFCRLKRSKGNLKEIVQLEGEEEVFHLLEKGQGVVFLTGHQANWEIPFLALTDHHEGIAIGRPIKNKWLYNYILSVREMNGGKIVMPRNAIKEGLRALQKGKFIGIVGDQALPQSTYSYPLFGTRAWTASTPAILAYRTNSPLVVGMTKRVGHRYVVTGSKPLWPNLENPQKDEVKRLMDEAMAILEKSILEHPGQWMWQHDRWKQQEIDHLKRIYRFGFVLIVLAPDFDLSFLPTFKTLYPRSFVTLFVKEGTIVPEGDYTIRYYKEERDLFVRDFRYQLLFDFYGLPALRAHFKGLGVMKTVTLKEVQAAQGNSFEDQLTHFVCKKECLPIATL